MSDFGLGAGVTRFDQYHSRSEGGMLNSSARYPSPFFDIGHTYLPTSVKHMFRWCRYYFLTSPLINAVTYKMAEYPVTPIIVDEANADTRTKWQEIIEHVLKIRTFQIETGLDYFCLHGDVKAVTREGIFRLRDLAGRTVDVLSQDGIYRRAEFKSYGTQELLEVEFSDGSTMLATPEHQWPVISRSAGIKKVPTTKLKGRYIPRTVAPRPEQNDDFYEGVRHGFVFGDGTLYNDGKQARAYFYGSKDRDMLKYFEAGSKVTQSASNNCLMIHGLPASYKQMPENTASASYWYGFISGFLAADGSVDVNGCVVLTQKSTATLERIAEQLPRVGMAAGKIRSHERSSTFEGKDGITYSYDGKVGFLSLLKQYMQPQDFLISRHRQRFEENYRPTENRKMVEVVDVRTTGIFDEVFCCVEPETHTFTVGNGILTGNCYGIAVITVHFPFDKYLTCPVCKTSKKIGECDYKFRNLQYMLSCDNCATTSEAIVQDVNVKNLKGIRLIRWNPEYLLVEHNDLTGDTAYFFDMPTPIRNDVTMGKRHTVETIPDIYIQALREQKMLRFTPESIFVLRRPTIAQKDMGWGMPLILPVLKDNYYLQILRKGQEAIANGHIMPLRLLFPQPGGASADPYSTTDLGMWRKRIEAEVQKWKMDPNYIPILPLPIGSENIGGDARAMMLHQEMRAWSEQIVAGMQVPNEFVFGGLSYSGSNMSLRMLENQFLGYRENQLVMVRDFILGRIADFMDWPRPKIRFQRFRMADDLQRLNFYFQMNQAMKISDTTLLDEADMDAVQEEKYKAEEFHKQIENQRRMQMAQAALQGEMGLVQAKYQIAAQKMQMAAGVPPQQGGGEGAGGGGAGGGMPGAEGGMMQPLQGEQAAPGMPTGATVYPENASQPPSEGVPLEMQSPLQAGQQQGGMNVLYLARRAATELGKMDEGSRVLELMKMRSANPALYTVVFGLLEREKGEQKDPLNASQSPLAQKKPPRSQTPLV